MVNSSEDLKYIVTNLSGYCNNTEDREGPYLVYSSKCKIPNMDVYNTDVLPYFLPKKYTNCSNKTKLSYITREGETAVLHLNHAAKDEYSTNTITCCYEGVDSNTNFIDAIIKTSTCQPFSNNVALTDTVVLVTCKNENYEEIYKNIHAVINRTEVIAKMKQPHNPKHKPLSVLFIGIDSVSRLNMVRSLPNTYNLLTRKGWVEFKGYSKVGENTFPNVMGILTGKNESTVAAECNPHMVGQLDKCNFIWYDYKKLGFITAYAEDEAGINTFTYLKKGFEQSPTDYYFQPYILATEKHLNKVILDNMKFCTGPESAGERILNIARDFSQSFKNHSSFGHFWMNSFSHDELNAVSRMDLKIVDFLEDLDRTGVMKNTIVLFLSDHGFRFGKFTNTHSGWLEEKLPFFYMSVPKWFQKKFPVKYKNLRRNTRRLITPYDLYMTLQELLVLSGKNYEVQKSSGCPKCSSLFDEVERERSCEDVGIQNHWCTCTDYTSINADNTVVERAAQFILHNIHSLSGNMEMHSKQCLQYRVLNITSAGVSYNCDIKASSKLYFLITIQTKPHAVFKATVSINVDSNMPTFKMEGAATRIDSYSGTSWCVHDSVKKKYCYCNEEFSYIIALAKGFIKKILNFVI